MQFCQNNQSALLTEDQCKEFEREQSVTLPNDYKQFLQKTLNGGECQCEEPVVTVPSWGKTIINLFLGIGAYKYFNMENKIWILGEDRLPKSMIPIADDPGGNFFFLDTSSESSSKVYFYFHEEEPNDPPTATDNPSLTLLANSFSDFLENIECLDS